VLQVFPLRCFSKIPIPRICVRFVFAKQDATSYRAQIVIEARLLLRTRTNFSSCSPKLALHVPCLRYRNFASACEDLMKLPAGLCDVARAYCPRSVGIYRLVFEASFVHWCTTQYKCRRCLICHRKCRKTSLPVSPKQYHVVLMVDLGFHSLVIALY